MGSVVKQDMGVSDRGFKETALLFRACISES